MLTYQQTILGCHHAPHSLIDLDVISGCWPLKPPGVTSVPSKVPLLLRMRKGCHRVLKLLKDDKDLFLLVPNKLLATMYECGNMIIHTYSSINKLFLKN